LSEGSPGNGLKNAQIGYSPSLCKRCFFRYYTITADKKEAAIRNRPRKGKTEPPKRVPVHLEELFAAAAARTSK